MSGNVLVEPCADHRVHPVTVHSGHHPAHGRLVRGHISFLPVVELGAEAFQDALRRVRGPFPDRGERSRTGSDRSRGRQQDRGERMPHTSPGTRIPHTNNELTQVSDSIISNVGQPIQRSRNRAR